MNAGSERYLRHNLIDWFSQDEVSSARVAVIGAGAIGNEVVKNLALLGVGQIDVYDFDSVEIHNLTRSILLRESDVGQSKAQALVARAADIDPNCRLRAIDGDIRDRLSPAVVSGYRAVVGAVDNFEARLRLNQLCLLSGVDFINAAIDSRFVSLEVFAHSSWDVACYECHLPDSAYQRIAQRYSCGGLRKRAFDEKKVPTTAITASLAGAMAAGAALGLGRGPGQRPRRESETAIGPGPGQQAPTAPASRRVFIDSHTMQSQLSDLTRQAGCPACAGLAHRPQRVDINRFRALAGAASAAEAWTVVLPEPIIAGYHCQQCGRDRGAHGAAAELMGMRGRDFDDQLAWCPHCQAASMNIELRDRFSWSELETWPRPLTPAVPFALAHGSDRSLTLEWTLPEIYQPQPTSSGQ